MAAVATLPTAPITADQVAVSVTGDSVSVSLDFQGTWIVQNGGSMGFDVGYTISSTSVEPAGIGFFDFVGDADPSNTGSLRYRGQTIVSYIDGTLAPPPVTIVAAGPNPSTLGISGFGVTATTADLIPPDGCPNCRVGGEFGITEFDERFISSPVIATPEPKGMTLIAVFMIAIVLAVRKRFSINAARTPSRS